MKMTLQHWRKSFALLVLKTLAWMLHCFITIGHFIWIFILKYKWEAIFIPSSVSGHGISKSETVALHVVKVVSWGERLCYLDGWCRGRTRWWRCGSRAQRSPLASPAGGIYSGSRRTRSSLYTSRSTQALGNCCANICNLKIIMKRTTHTVEWYGNPEKSV